jgi:PAS domain S-box-containing protein
MTKFDLEGKLTKDKTIRVLCVEDNPHDLALIRDALEQQAEGFMVVAATDRKCFEKTLAEGGFDVVLSDFNILGYEGIEVIRKVKEHWPDVPIILVTGTGSEEIAVEALKAGAADYVIKTIKHITRLPHTILNALQRQRVQKELTERDANLRAILENISDGILVVDDKWVIVYANPAAGNMLGTPPEKLVGQKFEQDITHIQPEEIPLPRRAGGPGFAEMHIAETTWADKKSWIISLRDITKRKEAEGARLLLETAINHAVECIFITDRQNRITYVNRAFEKITGYSADEVLGKTPGFLQSGEHDREFYQDLKSTIYNGRPWQGYLINRKKDGSLYEVQATIAPIHDASGKVSHFVSVHRDVTREREFERRQQQNQRLEAIGVLAGGIAHDFNNLLTPIIGYTELSLSKLPPDSPVRDDLEQVLLAAKRATDLVRQILAFSSQQQYERKPISVGLAVKEVLKLLRATLPATIEIKQKIDDSAGTVVIDPTEIQQVIMNLCTNAYQAMPEGGVLTVELKEMTIERDVIGLIPDLPPGKYLKLSVSDTGCGIPRDIIDKIFEPYFTTKGEGRGTGLGLFTTYSIVRSCGGSITVYSEPGKGTVFHVYLPVTKQKADTAQKEKKEMTSSGKGERILFVDDEAIIAELAKSALEPMGYTVTICTDPRKALTLFLENPSGFDLVITDMTMPGMTGKQLAEEIIKKRPDLPVILCTGFSEYINKEQARNLGIRKFLEKPTSPSELATVVREALGSRETTR